MNLRDVILASPTTSEDLVVYAKRVNGRLLPSSEAVLLDLTEEEQDLNTYEVADRKCPGFSYCMERYLIQEMMEAFQALPENMDIDKKVDRIIYYIENDA